jgi:hypothetical protein
MTDHRAQLQTETTVGSQQGITSHLRSHLTIAQDEVREDCKHRATRGALETPDGDPTQADTDVMRVTRHAPTAATGRPVCKLKAEGEDERHHQFDKGFAVTKQLKVGRFILKIDGNGSVFAGLVSCVSHGSPSGQIVEIAGGR